MARSATQPQPPLLTPRQLDVLELMAKGLSNREIGRVLGIAAATVKRHVSAVIDALDVTNRTEAATALHELGLGTGPARPNPDHAVPGFGERPAIAVMPFENLSDDPEHAYLADGIVEDVITRLSGWRWFPVIARSSTYAYRGRSVDVREVSRDLGAPFIVTGSVRPVGGTLRISVQLIDGESGGHVWAQRYDRALEEIFELEGEIADTLAASIEPALVTLQGTRSLRKPPEHLGAWELMTRGFQRMTERSWESVRESQALFERAARLDEGLSLARAGLANFGIFELIRQGDRDPAEIEAEVMRLSEQAVSLDANEPMAHMTLGWGLAFARRPSEALTALDRSLELNPSLAWAHWGRGTVLWALDAARTDEGIAAIGRAIRLSPQDPFLPWMLTFLGMGQLTQGRLDEAEATLARSRRLAPEEPHPHPLLAACHLLRGETHEARLCIERMVEIRPGYSPLAHARRFAVRGHYDNYVALLAAAGWRA